MSPENFDAHPLWNRLDQIERQLEAAEAAQPQPDPAQLTEIRRLVSATRGFSEARDESELFADAMLARLDQRWNQVESLLSTFVSNPVGYSNYVNAAFGELDPIREELARLPRPSTSAGVKAAITRSLNDYVRQVETSRDSYAKQVGQLQQDVTARDEEHRAQVAVLSDQIASLSADIVASESRVATAEGRLDQSLSSNNEAFIAAQTARDKEFQTWLKAQAHEFQSLADPHLTSLKKSETDASEALAKVTNLRTSVVDMANITSGDILGGNYEKSAQRELRLASLGYCAGVLIGLGGLWAVFTAFGGVAGPLTPEQVALKLALGAGAGGIAAVAFRFGGQAMRRSTSFRRQELELRALAPFLEGVEPKVAATVRTAFVDRSFGRAFDADRGNSGAEKAVSAAEAEGDSLSALIKLAVTAVERIPKN